MRIGPGDQAASPRPSPLDHRRQALLHGRRVSRDVDERSTSANGLFLKVVDADLDKPPNATRPKSRIRTERGEDEAVELNETLGIAASSPARSLLKPAEKPTPGNLKPERPRSSAISATRSEAIYSTSAAAHRTGSSNRSSTIAVVIGTDGKRRRPSARLFGDEALAVETQFHIAESHFELFKSHKALGREAEAKADLEAGRRVLREVIEDYPNPKYTPRVSYLLGQFAQELKQYGRGGPGLPDDRQAVSRTTLSPRCPVQAGPVLRGSGEFNQALEAYVTLAATYPKHPLIANVMVRISEHFYKMENYKVAAQVGEKFLEKFEGHKWAPRWPSGSASATTRTSNSSRRRRPSTSSIFSSEPMHWQRTCCSGRARATERAGT